MELRLRRVGPVKAGIFKPNSVPFRLGSASWWLSGASASTMRPAPKAQSHTSLGRSGLIVIHKSEGECVTGNACKKSEAPP